MKKTIKEIRAAEIAARTAAEEAANRQAELDTLVEKDAFTIIPDIEAGLIAPVYDENENLIGVEGGKYHSTLVDGQVIAAETKEELETIKTRMGEGIVGDGMLHKHVLILGLPFDVHGRNEEELQDDYRAAEVCAYTLRNHIAESVSGGQDLLDSGYKADDGKVLNVGGETYYLLFKEVRAISTTTYETVIDLADKDQLGKDAFKLSKDNVEKLIVEKLEKALLEEEE